MSKQNIEQWIGTLVELLKPKEVIIAKTVIIGYSFDEKTKTLHFLSQKETKAYDKENLDWIPFGKYSKEKKEK